MKTKSLPPYAPTLIESTRAIGYSLEAAVADIIDNSIAANAKNVDIYFFPVDGAYIAILDNGKGMTEEEIDVAMQYGSKNPTEERDKKDLGRFGLGLKTASLSQCRCLTVISKQGDNLEGRQWDIDHVTEVGDWSLNILDEEDIQQIPQFDELIKNESGTLVVWQKLDRLKAGEINFELSLGRKIDRVRDHLSLVYHRYLAGESGITKLKLSINGEKIKGVDPFLTEKSVQAMDDETLVIQGNKILVRPYILPHISKLTSDEIKMLGGKDGLRKQQGFYVYRNKRLLVWGTWFRMMRQGDLSKLARIRVDIPNTLDDLWTLDIKKSSAYRTVADAIKDLEDIEPVYNVSDDKNGIKLQAKTDLSDLAQALRDSKILHNHIVTKTTPTAMERFKALDQGQNFHSLSDEMKTNTYTDVTRTQNTIYLRLKYDEPSGTVVNVRKSMWVHPTKDRAVSIREAARLQTFPDSFIFCGTKDKQYQQVGNAVPPIMAKAIAKKLANQLNKALSKN